MQIRLSRELQNLAGFQAGLLTRQQLLRSGLPAAVIDNQVKTRRWQQLQRGVYATFSGPAARPAELWAVALRTGPASALSHWTAAELYGLGQYASPKVHVTLMPGRRPGQIRGAITHYSRYLEITRHPALMPPRTRIDDTVLDLIVCSASTDEAFDWICRAIGRRLTTAAHLRTAMQARPRLRWRTEIAACLAYVDEGVRSSLERRYVSAVERAHRLPTARRQARVKLGGKVRYVDNLYEEALLAVELDGAAAHPPEQRWADSRRDAAHATLGILTVRYCWADIAEHPCDVAAQVATLLGQRGAAAVLRPCGPACMASAHDQPAPTISQRPRSAGHANR